MSTHDPFALGGWQHMAPEDGDDERILALFREWCTAWRATSDVVDELDAACAAANRIADQIYDVPVRGVVGLAIKAFMVAQNSDNGPEERLDDYCALGPFAESCYSRRALPGEDRWTDVAHLFMSSHALRGLLASAASFVPELRPLVADAIGSPLTLRFDDDREAAKEPVAPPRRQA